MANEQMNAGAPIAALLVLAKCDIMIICFNPCLFTPIFSFFFNLHVISFIFQPNCSGNDSSGWLGCGILQWCRERKPSSFVGMYSAALRAHTVMLPALFLLLLLLLLWSPVQKWETQDDIKVGGSSIFVGKCYQLILAYHRHILCDML